MTTPAPRPTASALTWPRLLKAVWAHMLRTSRAMVRHQYGRPWEGERANPSR